MHVFASKHSDEIVISVSPVPPELRSIYGRPHKQGRPSPQKWNVRAYHCQDPTYLMLSVSPRNDERVAAEDHRVMLGPDYPICRLLAPVRAALWGGLRFYIPPVEGLTLGFRRYLAVLKDHAPYGVQLWISLRPPPPPKHRQPRPDDLTTLLSVVTASSPSAPHRPI
jgi:hypothetical protein